MPPRQPTSPDSTSRFLKSPFALVLFGAVLLLCGYGRLRIGSVFEWSLAEKLDIQVYERLPILTLGALLILLGAILSVTGKGRWTSRTSTFVAAGSIGIQLIAIAYLVLGNRGRPEEDSSYVARWALNGQRFSATVRTGLVARDYGDAFRVFLICRYANPLLDLRNDSNIVVSGSYALDSDSKEMAVDLPQHSDAQLSDAPADLESYLCLVPLDAWERFPGLFSGTNLRIGTLADLRATGAMILQPPFGLTLTE